MCICTEPPLLKALQNYELPKLRYRCNNSLLLTILPPGGCIKRTGEPTLTLRLIEPPALNFPPFHMDNLIEDPATQEPTTDNPAPETTTETATSDNSDAGQQKDAAKPVQLPAETVRYIRELESKVKKTEKPDTRSKEVQELEWKLENKDRIDLVKDEYEKILEEGYQGEKVSKKIALELAEKHARIDTSGTRRARQDDMTTPSTTVRTASPTGYENEIDAMFGLTPAKIKELEARHPHLRG